MNIPQTKVMVVDKTTINVDNVMVENVGRLRKLQPPGKEPVTRCTTKNHGRLGDIHRDLFKCNLAICLER